MDKNARICIIGAGPAGISLAWYMRQAGYRHITLLEKAARSGGMTLTVEHGGKHFDLGANYVTQDYDEVRRLGKLVGAPLMTDTAFQKQASFDVGKSIVHDTSKAVQYGVGNVAFALGIARYIAVQWKYRKMVAAPGFLGIDQHPELMMSFGDFLRTNGLTAVERLFALPVTSFGYGTLDEIPAPYVLKYMTTPRFLTMVAIGAKLPTSWPRRFTNGFGNFIQKLAEGLDVRTNTNVTRVTRHPDRVEVQVEGEAAPQIYDQLVLACPLDGSLAFLDARPEERQLFSQIHYRTYYMTTAIVEDFGAHAVINEMNDPPTKLFPPHPHTWIFGKQWEDSPYTLFYTSVEAGTSEAEVKAVIREDLEKLFKAAGKGRFVRWEKFEPWRNYFPYVSTDAMCSERGGAGFYDQVEAMQGTYRTWYTGGILAFELIENIFRYNRDLVERRL